MFKNLFFMISYAMITYGLILPKTKFILKNQKQKLKKLA